MATIALGFVGQSIGAAIGGTVLGVSSAAIGGYIGAMVGGLIDNRLFPQRVEGPRLNDLSVTASTYGIAIPIAYGPRVRLAGNIIYSSGLIERSSSSRQGGKGGGGTVVREYNYHTHVAVALCEGVVNSLTKIWANGKLIFDNDGSGTGSEPIVWAAGSAQARAAEIRFYPGSFTQPVDTTMEGDIGAGDVPAYLGTCYVMFDTLQLADFGNRLPNFEFEIEVQSSVDATDIVSDICTRAGVTAPALGQVSGLAIEGYLIGRETSAWGGIQPIALVHAFDMADRSGTITAVKRGHGPRATIPPDDLAAVAVAGEALTDREPKIKLNRKEDWKLPKRAALTYADTTLDLQEGGQDDETNVGNSDNDLSAEIPVSLAPNDAKTIVARMLDEAWASRANATIRLTERWHFLEASNSVVIPIEGDLWLGRIDRITRSPNGLIDVELVSDDPLIYQNSLTAQTGILPANPLATTVDTRLIVMDTPILLDSNDDSGFYWAVAGEATGWRGAQVQRSIDAGASYDNVGSMGLTADIGDMQTTLAAGPTDIWDLGNTFQVTMLPEAVIDSATDIQVFSGYNLAWIGPANGQGGEFIQFKTATLQSGTTYLISDLLRGRMGTEHAVGSHGAGEVFVIMWPSRIMRSDYSVSDWNRSRLYRAVSVYQDTTIPASIDFTNTGEGKRPLSPVHPRGVRDSGNDLTLTWTRRTRLGVPGLGMGPVPLGEEYEAYEVDIESGSSVLRTITSSTPQIIYTAAEQTADGLTPGNQVSGTIYQMSSIRGRGRGRTFTV